MKRPLRRSVVGVSVTYSGGDYSNNLIGCNLELEYVSNRFCVSIDLTRNIRVRNKHENCFYDGCQLIEQHAELSSVQIDDEQVFERLAPVFKRFPRGTWQIELSLGEKGTFKYLATPKTLNGSVVFDVLEVA